MKRFLAALLALALLLPCAQGLAATKTARNAFSVTYPDAWTLTEDFTDDNTDEYQWLFLLSGDGMFVEVYACYYESFDDCSMIGATQQQLDDYRDATLQEHETDCSHADYIETLYARSGSYTVPIQLYHISDTEEGPSYHAETMTKGWAFVLWAYNEDYSLELTDEQIQIFRDIVLSFVPVK